MAEQAIRDRIRACSAWRICRQLGRGQYGTAYLVEWAGAETEQVHVGDQAVAKVVGLEFLPEKEQTMAFQEVELLRDLKHPGIVGLRDHFMTEANLELVIVMEFCDGGDLRGEVKRRTQTTPPRHIPEAQIMTWFVQLTLALNYMHNKHILHRDLKSSNIFLITNEDEGHDVKIGDFGISRVLEGTVDVAATVVGTPYYMSPEVCKAEAYGFKSDIWALGCVLYEMCMLKHAFESASLLGLVYKIVSETYDPIPPQYSSDLRSMIDRVLDKSHYTRLSGKELVAEPYFRKFMPAKRMSERTGGEKCLSPRHPHQAPPHRQCRASLKPGTVRVAASGSPSFPADPLRGCEASPAPPAVSATGPGGDRPSITEDQPVRREWCAPPFVGATPGAAAAPRKLDDGELRAKVFISRIHRALAVRRQNWLQIFASFDHLGNGQLQEAEFDRAVTSMALGLSDAEIREVRARLQGNGVCVPVYEFGKALHGTHPQVTQLEDWGRTVLTDLAREAARAEGGSNAVAAGAAVRVFGLQSAAGMKLNGSEGVVDSWDAGACRWVVRVTDGGLRSIRDENLEVLRPAASVPSPNAGGILMTTALYRMLCEGGENAVSEARFLSVVERLLPKLDESERRRLLLLLPKSPEGRVDVPEVLAQLVVGSGGAPPLRMAAAGLGGMGLNLPPKAPQVNPSYDPGQPAPGGGRHTPFSASPTKVSPTPSSPPHVPGAVPSPRARTYGLTANPPCMPGGGGSTSSTARPSGGGGEGARADVALLRLAQRLTGRTSSPGPGVEVLRLFAECPEELRPEELSHAASVLPLGISRAEVTSVLNHVRATAGNLTARPPSSGAVPFSQMLAAVEAALSAGVPSEAATLEHLNEKRLAPALQKLSATGQSTGRASPQEFRVTLMQAEPYLTHCQLEWLMMLTDKDGEGRLLPGSLLARLGWEPPTNAARGHRHHVLVPPRPAISSRVPIAPHTPRSLVVAATLARVRGRLVRAGPQLRLERVLGLFFDVSRAPAPAMGRETLATMLGHLRLGISATEADELVSSCTGGRPTTGEDAGVVLAGLYEKLQRAQEPEMEEHVVELEEAARARLLDKGSAFASAALALDSGDWIPEVEFRHCLNTAFAGDPDPLAEEEEERLLLLAEKTAAGGVHWRLFAVVYAGWQETDPVGSPSDQQSSWQPQSPKQRNPAQHLRFDRTDPSCTAQSWRSAKTAQAARTMMTPMHEKSGRAWATSAAADGSSPAKSEALSVPKGALCPCRRRCSR